MPIIEEITARPLNLPPVLVCEFGNALGDTVIGLRHLVGISKKNDIDIVASAENNGLWGLMPDEVVDIHAGLNRKDLNQIKSRTIIRMVCDFTMEYATLDELIPPSRPIYKRRIEDEWKSTFNPEYPVHIDDAFYNFFSKTFGHYERAEKYIKQPDSSLKSYFEPYGDLSDSILVNVSSSDPKCRKTCTPAHWSHIIKALVDEGFKVVVTGQGESPNFENMFLLPDSPLVLNLINSLQLPHIHYLTNEVRTTISGDSGPGHLAAAQGKNVISLFSASLCPEHWAPRGPNVTVLFTEEEHPDSIPISSIVKTSKLLHKV